MTIGIVAEYNPFHNGHKFQIDYAKKVLSADTVVVAMSGSFTQRGEIACYDKYVRAEAALKCGADIILEIPTIFATSSAREFASAGVALLAATNVVDTILFGAECDDVNMFKSCAIKLNELENSGQLDESIRKSMASGQSFATARSKALEAHIPAELISSPNNILGLEYCRYIDANKLNMDIAIIKRQGNDYNSTELTGEISSASAIRKNLNEQGVITAVPETAKKIYEKAIAINPDSISEMLHYKLLSTLDFSNYLDCNKDLSDRINNSKGKFISFTQFCDLLKSKNNTYSKISRVLCHILLDITWDDFEVAKNKGYISYIRMLGFSKNGAALLSAIKEYKKVPLLTRPNDLTYKSDIYSSDIYRAVQTAKSKAPLPTEYTRKFTLNNI
ncbi:Predicted nucleotidyltransferase [Pseudobutyrivibrio sp. OR37]|uniref:tRNA(Met) cytidine acetate ligase n=1 Tax=Pseudobutyrivibrio sp. OR37 TaxID=1798186 RepID=UPI0008EC5D06|nr:nucleotidyltransferase family protein [Pseudobutyrivibrio sp. OR37]SFH62270.1 Predicted nucleotidyltransferase [Pseudobutyrivibrio sp. OR37]